MDRPEPERAVAEYDPAIVEDLAHDFDIPVELITDVYEQQLARLAPEARVKSFLPVIAAHQVRVALIKRRDSHPAAG